MTLRTLIVDDEPLARERVRMMLGMHDDVAVVGEYGDGQQAIDAIRTQRPDLVFLDVQMPKLNGFEVLELIGRSVPVAGVKVKEWVAEPNAAPLPLAASWASEIQPFGLPI